MNRFCLLVLIILPFLTFISPAEPSPIVIDRAGSHPLGSSTAVFLDATGALTIDDVASAEFANQFLRQETENPRLGFVKGAAWVRLTFRNEMAQQDWILSLNSTLLDHADLYEPGPNGGWKVFRSGDSLAFASRGVAYRYLNFNIGLPTRAATTVYLRLATAGTIFLPLHLWSIQALEEKIAAENFALGVYYGIFLALTLYNLFLFFALRDKSYLYYVLYIATFGMFQMGWDGLSFQYFWPGNPWWYNQSIQFFVGLVSLFSMLFTRNFLGSRHRMPRFDWFLRFAILVALLQVAALAVDRQIAVMFTVPSGLINSVGIFTASLYIWRAGYQPARFFFFAWLAMVLGSVAIDLKEYGLLPLNFVTEYGLRLGAAIEALLLSFALADRINLIRAEKELAQREALDTERKALETQRTMVKSFSRFVPREFLEQLQIDSIVNVKLGDQVHREMTIMFSDIRDFTTLSEGLTPKENFDFINAYLENAGPEITRQGGFIDKYIGDAIMALFPRDADDAVRAAIGLARCRDAFNARRGEAGQPPIGIGVGLHSGKLMLGVVGEHERMEGTVIADAVNAASRIEGLTKVYGATIIISEETFIKLRDPAAYGLRYLGWAGVKGKKQGLSLFEVFDGDSAAHRDAKFATRQTFETGVAHFFAEEYDAAATLFAQVLAENPHDNAAHYFASQCAALQVPG